MANIQKRGDSYRIRVSDGFDPDSGKRRYQTLIWKPDKGMTDLQIEKELERQKVLFEEKCRQQYVLDSSMTFENFVEMWRKEYGEPYLKRTTLAHYDDLLKRIIPAIGHLKLSEITPFHLNAFYANLREDGIRVDYKCACKVDFKKLLRDNGITQQRLADYAGLSKTTIESLAAGNNVNRQSAEKLCQTMELTMDELFDVVDTRKSFAQKTVLHYHRCISAILAKSVKWGILFSNPCERVDPPKLRRHEAVCLNEEQTIKLLNEVTEKAPFQYQVMVKLMLYSGARRGEVCGLNWSDVDWEHCTIHIQRNSLYLPSVGMYEDTTKTESSDRVVRLPAPIFQLLKELKALHNTEKSQMGDAWHDSERIFTQWNGSPIHPSSITTFLNKFCVRNKLPHVSPHMLRHTSATLLLMEGIPLKAVSKRLGHSLASTTSDIYGHSLKSVEDIAADKLDKMLSPSEQLKDELED